MKKLLCLLIVVFMLSGCDVPGEDSSKTIQEQAAQILELKAENEALAKQLKAQAPQAASLLSTAQTVVQLIKDQDMAGLSAHVHPVQGVRFSPYSHVNLQTDLVFSSQQIAGLMQDSTVQTWGVFDGSGDPIQMDFASYYTKFVYDQDYINPHMIGNNTLIGTGNTINNVAQIYPAASFVEFHFTGFDPQYSGMDWTSLRLIFENVGGTWMLIGIQHDGWTI